MEQEAAHRGGGPVMVPLDGSALAERALPWALAAARRERAPLLLVRVVPTLPLAALGQMAPASEEAVLEAERASASEYLEQVAGAARRTAPDITVQTDVSLGDAAAELLVAEQAYGVRLVVLTTHGRSGLGRWVRGSVAEQVLHDSSAPVLLVRPWDPMPAGGVAAVRRVLVPLDGSRFAEEVLSAACRLVGSRHTGGEVVLACVVPRESREARGPHPSAPPGRPPDALGGNPPLQTRSAAADYLELVGAGLRERDYRVRQVVLSAADTVLAIVEQAILDQADVIAMSTHGRAGIGRLLHGSTADRVLRAARVPVLLYRPRAGSGAAAGLETGADPGAPTRAGPEPPARSRQRPAAGA